MEGDFELLGRWRTGDRDAGEQLFARYFAEVSRFFQNKIDDKADDLVQQTFLACVKSRDQFRHASSFRTYLFAIARNELYMELRKPSRDHVDLEVSSLNELVSSPSKRLRTQQDLARLRAALGELPVEQQVLLELHYWHDLVPADLAQVFSTSAGSIRVRLLRARRALRARLAEHASVDVPGDPLWGSLRAAELDGSDGE